jgi:phosphoribosyl 1,2-cyclic phosphate phosphodiesterase
MRLSDVYELVEILYKQGTLHANSTVFLSHINHSSSHSDMEDAVKSMNFPINTIVAYDGMKIFD